MYYDNILSINLKNYFNSRSKRILPEKFIVLQLPSTVDNIALITIIDLKNSLREDYFDLIPQSSNRDINVEF